MQMRGSLFRRPRPPHPIAWPPSPLRHSSLLIRHCFVIREFVIRHSPGVFALYGLLIGVERLFTWLGLA
jgi:hypothetical protein